MKHVAFDLSLQKYPSKAGSLGKKRCKRNAFSRRSKSKCYRFLEMKGDNGPKKTKIKRSRDKRLAPLTFHGDFFSDFAGEIYDNWREMLHRRVTASPSGGELIKFDLKALHITGLATTKIMEDEKETYGYDDSSSEDRIPDENCQSRKLR
mmetsp:Transcript_1508/g.2076  ORF Transcript_1508/g.2076 Transcript_1508/m.2076 type:complete len:150 (-) Transcript_1508:1185-1634(-)